MFKNILLTLTILLGVGVTTLSANVAYADCQNGGSEGTGCTNT
jgi:hypothetical protein